MMRKWFVVLLAVWIFPHAQADTAKTLKVLSYNIHGLPEPLVKDRKQFQKIGDLLRERRENGTAPDVVAIQEGFTRSSEELITRAGYPYVALGNRQNSAHPFSSGLIVLSQYPIELTHTIDYSTCLSWDCLSNKGALHARIRVPGLPAPVDIYNTHLNANPVSDPKATPEECKRVRMIQIAELSKFIDDTRSADSFVIAPGDYNSLVQSDELEWFYGHTLLHNALSNCANGTAPCHDNAKNDSLTAIDHQFYQSARIGGSKILLSPTQYVRNFSELFENFPLSDHLGLEIDYAVSWVEDTHTR